MLLPLTVTTESGPERQGVSAEELAALLAGLGSQGDHFVSARHTSPPAASGGWLRVLRAGSGPFELEREEAPGDGDGSGAVAGGPGERRTARVETAREAAALFSSWAAGEDGWDAGIRWQPVDHATPQLSPHVREEAEELARELVHAGFDGRTQIAADLLTVLGEGRSEPRGPSAAEARGITDQVWDARLAEQREWPETTEADRVERAFEAMAGAGVTARMHFQCCMPCAVGAVEDERAEGEDGFAFFHVQDTDAAVEGRGLFISFGSYDGDPAREALIADRVTEALRHEGLPVHTVGDPEGIIHLHPLRWRKRLPTEAPAGR